MHELGSGHIKPDNRLKALCSAYIRLKPKIPIGNARQEIEKDLNILKRIPKSLVASSSEFVEIFDRLKIKFIRLDDPDSD